MKRILFPALIPLLFALFAAAASAQCDHQKMGKTESDGGQQQGASAQSPEYTASRDSSGWQTATIVIKNGYSPRKITVKKDIPVRLVFDLQEKSCTDVVVFKDLHIRKQLRPFEKTAIEFTPLSTGSFAFSCPMEMIRGTLVVKD